MRAHGEAIRGIRAAQNKSVRELAEAVGVSPPFLSKLERGLVGANDDTLAAIATALDVPVTAIERGGGMTVTTAGDSIDVDIDDTVLYDIPTAARRIGKTADWLTKAVRRGEVPYTRVGRTPMFSPGNLRAFIAMNQVLPKSRSPRSRRKSAA